MNDTVQQAVEEIRNAYRGHSLDVSPDDEGGAFVKVHDLPLGEQYQPGSSWVAFRITFQYPFADVYPHYCVANLTRKDGRALGSGFSQNIWKSPAGDEAATMISRRSNQLNAATDTAALKLAKILDWIKHQ
jgi:hypothetical protein